MSAKWMNNIGEFTKQNAPTILSSIAVAGVVGTVILAVRATPKAIRKIDEGGFYKLAKDPEAEKKGPLVTNREIVAACWTFYIPAGLSAVATIACIIGANQIGLRRNAALVAAYTLVDQTFREYKNHVLEELGEAKELKIHDKMMAARMENSPPKDGQVIVIPGGEHMIYESLTDRYFRSDIEKIRQAENEFNREMLTGNVGYESLNTWFDYLGLQPADVGDILGFNLSHMLKLRFTSHLNACTSEPCLAIAYEEMPSPDYHKMF